MIDGKSDFKEKLNTIQQYIKSKKKFIFIGITTGILLLGTTFGYNNYQSNITSVYHVLLNDEEIGVVDDKSIIETWQSQQFMKAQAKYGSSINLRSNNNISFIEDTKYEGKYDNYQALKNLNNSYHIQAAVVELIVDGVVVGIVKDKATADKILNDLKEVYNPKSKKAGVSISEVKEADNNASIQVESVGIKEKIETKQSTTSPDAIIDQETMLTLLQKGTLEERKYTVQKGDTISEIAVNFDLTTAQVYQLNPQLSGEIIRIRDELTVTAFKPMVTVEAKEIVTQIERIPYQVEYQKDDTMYVYESKVIKSGKEGSKEVQYSVIKENGIEVERKVLNEKVLKEPVTKVIARGTKPAVEGSVPSIWPVTGRVSSYYGYRTDPINGLRSFHNGIDIAAVYGTPIYATANGIVIFSSWNSGGYGNEVIIDHQNGYVTYYGHNSKNLVKKGDYVKKGQVIAYIGSTGRSTGPHVDYRISINGKKVNPINYIK